MLAIAPTKLSVSGVPVEFIEGHAITITVARGPDHGLCSFIARKDGPTDRALARKRNPVSIEIETSSVTDVRRSRPFKLDNWHIIERRETDQGWILYTLADVRWLGSYQKLTAQFNIVSYGGLYRAASLNGGQPWKAYDAAKRALELCGYQVRDNPRLDPAVRQIELPDNLGNSEGGGFVAAPQALWLPALLNPCQCDLVPIADGAVMIVDRTSPCWQEVRDTAVAGAVSATDQHWAKPAYIDVPFEQRFERRTVYSEGGRRTATPDPTVLVLDNVVPNYQPNAQVNAKQEHVLLETWCDQHVADGNWPVNFRYLGSRWLRTRMFNDDDMTPEQAGVAGTIENLARQCWRARLRFRTVNTNTGALDDVRGRYADVNLGRLKADGTTSPDGVYADYTALLRYGRRKKGEHILQARFSEDFPYSATKPAPWRAVWVDREQLVFHLQGADGAQVPVNVKGFLLARLDKPIQYPGVVEALKKGKLVLETDATMKAEFQMSLFWNGLWLGSPGVPRLKTVLRPGLDDGDGLTLALSAVQDLTANFDADGKWLNAAECQERAEELAREVRDSFDRGVAGISTHGGVDVPAAGHWVNGDIHELRIEIGARGVGSVSTRLVVMPGKRPRAPRVFTGPRSEGSKSQRIL